MKNRQQSGMQSAAALLLLAVFAGCVILTLLAGSNIYAGISDRDRATIDNRILESYITARVRSYDAAGMISILDGNGEPARSGPVLAMLEEIDGGVYATELYSMDGWLMELFTTVDAGVDMQDGDRILQSGDMEFAWHGDGIRVEWPDHSMEIPIRSERTLEP